MKLISLLIGIIGVSQNTLIDKGYSSFDKEFVLFAR